MDRVGLVSLAALKLFSHEQFFMLLLQAFTFLITV
jgi:hypothetical protein